MQEKTRPPPLLQATYCYDGNGNRVGKAEKISGGLNHTEIQTYQTVYQYDAMNRLTAEETPEGSITYTYDHAGNRIECIRNGHRESYRYNVRNQLTERTGSEGSIQYQYDGAGNLIQETETNATRTYTYDVYNRNTTVTGKDFAQKNLYDGEGYRCGMEENGAYTNLVYHDGLLVSEHSDTDRKDYILGNGYIGEKAENAGSYYITDEQDSVRYVISESGEPERYHQYDAFGNTLIRQGKKCRLGYNSQQEDELTGLYYLRARYYQPKTGRFIQEDVVYNDGLNLYAYCNSNPVVYCDPSGLTGEDTVACEIKINDGGRGSEGGLNSGNEPTKYGSPYSQLSPKQKRDLRKKLENRTITKNEYNHLEWDRRFGNRRKRGVDRFWSKERNDIINGGQGTRNWDQQQRQDIINRKTPSYNGEPIEGHHKYNAIDYPQIADDPNNIYLATNTEHFERWHGGNYQNDTSGVPNNPDFPEEF